MIVSDAEGKQHRGVAVWVHKNYARAVSEYETVSSRCVVVRVNAKPVDLVVVQCYAPTTAADEDEVEEFFETLQAVLRKWKNKGMLVILGDFNAKVGEIGDGRIAGSFGLGVKNEAGENLIDFLHY
jgi:exonuclease III